MWAWQGGEGQRVKQSLPWAGRLMRDSILWPRNHDWATQEPQKDGFKNDLGFISGKFSYLASIWPCQSIGNSLTTLSWSKSMESWKTPRGNQGSFSRRIQICKRVSVPSSFSHRGNYDDCVLYCFPTCKENTVAVNQPNLFFFFFCIRMNVLMQEVGSIKL